MRKPIVIIGAGEFAEIACEAFRQDSPFDVAAFSVHTKFLTTTSLLGLPLVPFEDLHRSHPPEAFDAFVAVGYSRLNRVRALLCAQSREKGFSLVTYVSSRATIWSNASIGANCFLLEGVLIQHRAQLGDDVIVWSGSQILHRAMVGDHCFFSGHVVVGGFARIGDYTLLGLNSTIRNDVTIGKDCVIGAGAVVVAPTQHGRVYQGNPARPVTHYSSVDIIEGRHPL